MNLSEILGNLRMWSFWVVSLENAAKQTSDPNAMVEDVMALINRIDLPERYLIGKSNDERVKLNDRFHEKLKNYIIVNGVVKLEKLNEIVNKLSI